ncbi:MAG TPA: hypothetical protein VN577_02925 [Terriglobales bacterium]|nr:hypothetical protein [Terriglobales bacterium]
MNFRYRTWYVLIPVLLCITISLDAQTPNFSGIWKLDKEKSDFGPQPPPDSAEYVIRHIGSRLSFNFTQDGETSRVDLTPDNEERVTSSNSETATWTRAHFAGDTLVIESRERRKYGIQVATGTGWTSRWSLSPDGKELIIERTIRNALMEAKQRIVYDKRPLPKASSSQ